MFIKSTKFSSFQNIEFSTNNSKLGVGDDNQSLHDTYARCICNYIWSCHLSIIFPIGCSGFDFSVKKKNASFSDFDFFLSLFLKRSDQISLLIKRFHFNCYTFAQSMSKGKHEIKLPCYLQTARSCVLADFL